jgi:1-acyl-sn-glycerol-3-phosphate acyltransferase
MFSKSSIPWLWYELCKGVVSLVGSVVWRTRYFGRENIPAEGAAMIVCNHQSHLDPPLVSVGCPRQIYIMARKTLFDNPVFGRLIRSIHAVPIDRDGVGAAGIKECLKLLKRGEILLIFPEGTRSPNGQVQPFRPGFVTLAARTGAAIVPAAIEGAQRVWPRSRSYPLPGKVFVRYGEALSVEEVQQHDPQKLLEIVQQRVLACQADLRKQLGLS